MAFRIVKKAKRKAEKMAVCSKYGYVYWERKR